MRLCIVVVSMKWLRARQCPPPGQPNVGRFDQSGPHAAARSVQAAPSEQSSPATAEPNCPCCNGAMVCWMTKIGTNAGSEFWGASPRYAVAHAVVAGRHPRIHPGMHSSVARGVSPTALSIDSGQHFPRLRIDVAALQRHQHERPDGIDKARQKLRRLRCGCKDHLPAQ